MGSRAGGLLGTSAPQAAEPSEKIGTITRSAVPSLGQGTVRPSPPRSLGSVFSYRQQLSGSRSRVSGCENLPSSPCLGQLKLFCRAQRRTQRRPKGHCVTAEPGCGQEERVASFQPQCLESGPGSGGMVSPRSVRREVEMRLLARKKPACLDSGVSVIPGTSAEPLVWGKASALLAITTASVHFSQGFLRVT